MKIHDASRVAAPLERVNETNEIDSSISTRRRKIENSLAVGMDRVAYVVFV